jgi:hypothetical protein
MANKVSEEWLASLGNFIDREMGAKLNILAKRKYRAEFTIDVSLCPLNSNRDNYIIYVNRDIVE